ncbi:MAG: calcium/sodium antiporter [Muribaculaceae bacterium]|nr:calcium/sodium antiporter [Muribaculaceae bacterium]
MILNILFLIGGLVLILLGANCLTDGASSVAKKWGVSDLVIGLTIVAFGTSAPELVISSLSAINDSAELAIGNVVGSNLFNVLMIIGCVSLVMPIKVDKSIMSNEIPLVILSALAMLFCANDIILNGGTANLISRADGLILLLFFAIFMRYTFSIATKGDCDDNTEEIKTMSGIKASLFIIGGLAGLIFGGQFFVDGASGIALSMGVSESIVGLTIVAAGTSLPELATSLTAAFKKNSGMAIGNVIGSNIFNSFFILGCASTISPLPMGSITNFDLLSMVGASILFFTFGWLFKQRTITRIEGAIMVACYIAYTTYLVMQAT